MVWCYSSSKNKDLSSFVIVCETCQSNYFSCRICKFSCFTRLKIKIFEMRLWMFTILDGSQTPESSSKKINERTNVLVIRVSVLNGRIDGYLTKRQYGWANCNDFIGVLYKDRKLKRLVTTESSLFISEHYAF